MTLLTRWEPFRELSTMQERMLHAIKPTRILYFAPVFLHLPPGAGCRR
jgi:hypothetical protein